MLLLGEMHHLLNCRIFHVVSENISCKSSCCAIIQLRSEETRAPVQCMSVSAFGHQISLRKRAPAEIVLT